MLEGKIFSLKWIKPTTQGPQVADSVHFPLKEYCKRMKRRQILHEECNYIFFWMPYFPFQLLTPFYFKTHSQPFQSILNWKVFFLLLLFFHNKLTAGANSGETDLGNFKYVAMVMVCRNVYEFHLSLQAFSWVHMWSFKSLDTQCLSFTVSFKGWETTFFVACSNQNAENTIFLSVCLPIIYSFT